MGRDIAIEFVAARAFAGKSEREKLKLLLDAVKADKIIVLEGALSREEEKDLITRTMESVSKNFPGIEISSFGEEPSSLRAQLVKLFGGTPAGLTVIGPSNLVKLMKRNPTSLHLLAGKK